MAKGKGDKGTTKPEPEVRTEEEKLTRAPIVVILGGNKYEIAPLVIKYSRDWRKKSIPLIGYLIGYADSPKKNLTEAITELFTTKTDEILDSFFEYARDLPRDEVEENATDGEIILAFLEVFNAFVSPFSSMPQKARTQKRSSQ